MTLYPALNLKGGKLSPTTCCNWEGIWLLKIYQQIAAAPTLVSVTSFFFQGMQNLALSNQQPVRRYNERNQTVISTEEVGDKN